jgi:hypothetical protein
VVGALCCGAWRPVKAGKNMELVEIEEDR